VGGWWLYGFILFLQNWPLSKFFSGEGYNQSYIFEVEMATIRATFFEWRRLQSELRFFSGDGQFRASFLNEGSHYQGDVFLVETATIRALFFSGGSHCHG
jgi:hypothetical protein